MLFDRQQKIILYALGAIAIVTAIILHDYVFIKELMVAKLLEDRVEEININAFTRSMPRLDWIALRSMRIRA